MEFQCRRAERFYEEAREALAPEDRPSMLAAEIMGGIYRRILREIEKARYDVYNLSSHCPAVKNCGSRCESGRPIERPADFGQGDPTP